MSSRETRHTSLTAKAIYSLVGVVVEGKRSNVLGLVNHGSENRQSRRTRDITFHSGWALAVGGMTLAGVVLGVAGPLAGISLLLGSILALITVRSYFILTRKIKAEGVPVTYLFENKHPRLAVILSWWLIVVYVLAMGVYSFTFGHYLGRALGLPEPAIGMIIAGMVALLVWVNIIGIKEPASVQITAVWIELLMLAPLRHLGFLALEPDKPHQRRSARKRLGSSQWHGRHIHCVRRLRDDCL